MPQVPGLLVMLSLVQAVVVEASVCCPNDCEAYESFYCGGTDGFTPMLCPTGTKCGLCDAAFSIEGHCGEVTWTKPTPLSSYSKKFCEEANGKVIDAYYADQHCSNETTRGYQPNVYYGEACHCKSAEEMVPTAPEPTAPEPTAPEPTAPEPTAPIAVPGTHGICCPNECEAYESFYCGGADGLTPMLCPTGTKCGLCDAAFSIEGHCGEVTWTKPTPLSSYSKKFCEEANGKVIDAYYADQHCSNETTRGYQPNVYWGDACHCKSAEEMVPTAPEPTGPIAIPGTPGVCCPNDGCEAYESFYCGGADGLTPMLCPPGTKCGLCDAAFTIEGHCGEVTWTKPTPLSSYSEKFCEEPYGKVIDAYYADQHCKNETTRGYQPNVYYGDACHCQPAPEIVPTAPEPTGPIAIPGTPGVCCPNDGCEAYESFYCGGADGLTPMLCPPGTKCGLCDAPFSVEDHCVEVTWTKPTPLSSYSEKFCEEPYGKVIDAYYADQHCKNETTRGYQANVYYGDACHCKSAEEIVPVESEPTSPSTSTAATAMPTVPATSTSQSPSTSGKAKAFRTWPLPSMTRASQVISKECGSVPAASCTENKDELCVYDASCSSMPPRRGGLGCNAGGVGQNCRFCGFKNYLPCDEVRTLSNKAAACSAVPSPVCAGPSEPCYLDHTCSQSSPALSGLGCNAGGISNCRFCGFGHFPACPGQDPLVI